MSKHLPRWVRIVLPATILSLALTWTASAPLALAQDREIAVIDAGELLRVGSAQAMAGDFQKAEQTFNKLLAVSPDSAVASKARKGLQWAQSASAMAKSRETLRQETFAAHLTAARKLMEKEKWAKAIDHVRMARANSFVADDVWKLEFLPDLVKKVEKEIADHRAKNEWLDAMILYEVLGQVFEDDDARTGAYRKESTFCRQRAHFEATYTKDGAWKSDLDDIHPEIVRDALQKISDEYYKDVDFRELVLAGLDNIEIMVQTPKLRDVFKSLNDPDRVSDFLARIRAERGRMNARENVKPRDAMASFNTLLDINKDTVKLPENVLVFEFLSAGLAPLDEFTSMIWPSEMTEFDKHTHGEFKGVGIQITKPDNSYIRVETPLDDTPAYESGISPGDLILEVDGESTKGMALNDCVKRITGAEGTIVTLKVQKPDAKEPVEIKLKRRMIHITSVKGFTRAAQGTGWDYLIDPQYKIGYIRVTQFTKDTEEELKSALSRLREQGSAGLILDLRFNPGGLLTAAIKVCDLFLDEGQRIVKTSGRSQSPRVAAATGGSRYDPGPMIILVNGQSASASEIVAGTLSGNNKAIIVGERSFGKGSVQNLYEIANHSSYFKMTTALYYVPEDPKGEKWRCVHHNKDDKTPWGVEPNIAVKLIPSEVQKVWDLRRKQEVLRGLNQKTLPKEIDTPETPASKPAEDDLRVPNRAPDVDPQLETALSIMRMNLVVSSQPWAFAPRLPAKSAGG